ncbi:hypothetical protein FRD01_16755 [Microvenator marinus]|uniref:Uncharacterized protein n=1 Tax=Microvenator marinus TaxID=2600177 RepID=A0A5B8XT57_9DELT|nr:hypothetical protein [Microvenator marinus]QED28860.1 hypothetical protein FRD01_16755 [Microvenator marinus]
MAELAVFSSGNPADIEEYFLPILKNTFRPVLTGFSSHFPVILSASSTHCAQLVACKTTAELVLRSWNGLTAQRSLSRFLATGEFRV